MYDILKCVRLYYMVTGKRKSENANDFGKKSVSKEQL